MYISICTYYIHISKIYIVVIYYIYIYYIYIYYIYIYFTLYKNTSGIGGQVGSGRVGGEKYPKDTGRIPERYLPVGPWDHGAPPK